jgi:thiol-disulfide isomerase/thioredoxin
VVRALFFLILFYLCTICYSQDVEIKVGNEAPSFSLPTMTQEYIYLRDYCGEELRNPWKNKTKYVVVISFFASWCEPCLREIPHLQDLEKEFAGKDIKFFLINVGEEKEKIEELLKTNPIKLPILQDRYSKIAEKFDALTLPRLFVIGKDGIIKRQQKGFVSEEDFVIEMRAIINELLKE